MPTATPGVARYCFRATRERIFRAFPATANLADKADDGRIHLQVEASSAADFEPFWLGDAVEEPLDEAGIERE